MDKRPIIILLTALLVVMAPNVVLAGAGLPHYKDASNQIRLLACTQCHNSTKDLRGVAGYNNTCNACHKQGNLGENKPFEVQDAANPYGTITTARVTLYQTSHAWSGRDVNPAAGAQAPADPAMQNGNINGYLLCARCHDVHGAAVNYDPATTTDLPRFLLRVPNDNDYLCRQCHVARDKSSHMYGTHPITVNYSAARAKNPSGFKSVSSVKYDSKMKLNNGNLLCTTCHGVHYTDSKRGSFQNSSSFANLSTSKGMLLRTNPRGYQPDDPNICTDCHNGKMSHNGRGQNVQCNDCHSGHVEYDPLATPFDNATTKNKYLIRRYMNVSTSAGKKSRTFYRYTGANKEFWVDADRSVNPKEAVGVCQTCHYETDTFVKTHYVDGDRLKGHNENTSKRKCADCHNHDGSCASCHGVPPRLNNRGGGDNKGYAFYTSVKTGRLDYLNKSSFLDESLTPHSSHADADGKRYAIACFQCHHGNEKTHMTGDFQQVFKNHTGTNAGPIASYDKNNQRCSNVYCHSNAQDGVARRYTSVGWKNTKNTIMKGKGYVRCQSCHGDKNSINASSTALSGDHQRHAAGSKANYACQNCHAKTLAAYTGFENNTGLIYPAASHVNGYKDVSFKFPRNSTFDLNASNFSYNSSGKTCSNVYCHSNGKGAQSIVTPKWGDQTTGQCGTCHGVLGTEAAPIKFGMITSNAHFRHLSSTGYGPGLSSKGSPIGCQLCHTRYVAEEIHVVGASDLADFSAEKACYKCHGGWQQGAFSSSLGRGSLTWSDKTRIACTQCHPIGGSLALGEYSASRLPNGGNVAPKQINYSTTGHGRSASPFFKDSKKIVCADCHNQNSSHINKIPANAGVNKRLFTYSNLSTDFLAFNNFTGIRTRSNAVCNKCHWDGKSAARKVMFSHVTSVSEAVNNTPTMACSKCHNVHGSPSDHMIKNNIVFHANSSAYFIPYSSPYFVTYSSPDSTVVKSKKQKKDKDFKFIETVPPYRGICQVCHTKAAHFQRGRDEAVNGPSSGFNAHGAKIISHKNMNQRTNCLSCHAHNPPPTSPAQYAFYPFGNCDACHGYPPVPKSWSIGQNNYSSGKFEDYTGGGGSHVFQGHVPKSADPTKGWELCSSCHNEGDHLSVPEYAQVKVTGMNENHKFNGSISIQAKYSSNKLGGADHLTGTCYNVSCHFQRTPKWGKPEM